MFCSAGTKVPVTISAVDPESVVTAIGGTVNGTPFTVQPFTPANVVLASGEIVAPAVGAYTLGAWATSAGGTGTAPTGRYQRQLHDVLAAAAQHGSHDATVRSRSSSRRATATAPSLRTPVFGSRSGKATHFDSRPSTVTAATRFASRIRSTSPTSNPPTGNHTYTVKVFFNDYLQATTNVAVQ